MSDTAFLAFLMIIFFVFLGIGISYVQKDLTEVLRLLQERQEKP